MIETNKSKSTIPLPAILTIAFFLCCLAYMFMWEYATHPSKYALSKRQQLKHSAAEQDFVQELMSECDCEVELIHKYYLMENKKHWDNEDSTVAISFSWMSSSAKNDKNVCFKDSVSLRDKAAGVIMRLISRMSHREYYKHAVVYYSSSVNTGTGHIEHKCRKSIELELSDNGLYFLPGWYTDHLKYAHLTRFGQ